MPPRKAPQAAPAGLGANITLKQQRTVYQHSPDRPFDADVEDLSRLLIQKCTLKADADAAQTTKRTPRSKSGMARPRATTNQETVMAASGSDAPLAPASIARPGRRVDFKKAPLEAVVSVPQGNSEPADPADPAGSDVDPTDASDLSDDEKSEKSNDDSDIDEDLNDEEADDLSNASDSEKQSINDDDPDEDAASEAAGSDASASSSEDDDALDDALSVDNEAVEAADGDVMVTSKTIGADDDVANEELGIGADDSTTLIYESGKKSRSKMSSEEVAARNRTRVKNMLGYKKSKKRALVLQSELTLDTYFLPDDR